MTLSPTLPRRRARILAGDVAVILLVLLFAWLGVKVHDGVAELASLGRGLQDAGTAVAGTARDAAGALRGSPPPLPWRRPGRTEAAGSSPRAATGRPAPTSWPTCSAG